LLTVILALWLWLKESRRWLRWLGVAAVVAVILQGVLGGLRVTQLKDELGIFHAALAQSFFVLISAIALFLSRWWQRAPAWPVSGAKTLTRLYWLATALIFAQLVIGATMRHQHAGLAISDFPLAHQQIWPAVDSPAIARYNQERLEVTAMNAITAFQVILQMIHRIVALLIVAAVLWAVTASKRRLGWKGPLTKLSLVWIALIFTQVALGAATIWTNKSADIATAHVAVGSLSLLTGAMLILIGQRCLKQVPVVTEAFECSPSPAGSPGARISVRPAVYPTSPT
jgi:cytochrome c oxidase assembly protein subunit 15